MRLVDPRPAAARTLPPVPCTGQQNGLADAAKADHHNAPGRTSESGSFQHHALAAPPVARNPHRYDCHVLIRTFWPLRVIAITPQSSSVTARRTAWQRSWAPRCAQNRPELTSINTV